MTTLIWKLHRDASRSLGDVRTVPDLEVCAEGEVLWLRHQQASDELQQSFMKLPVVHFTATENGQLVERGTRVPLGYVPEGPWMAITDWMKVKTPIARLGGHLPKCISLEMVPCEIFELPQLLRTEIELWSKYAITAPRIRLERLAFAASTEGVMFIKGDPLPAIAGNRYVLNGRIAVQAGWKWQPAVDSEVLQAALEVRADDLVVMDGNGDWICIAEDCFVQATRSAVRATSEELGYVL